MEEHGYTSHLAGAERFEDARSKLQQRRTARNVTELRALPEKESDRPLADSYRYIIATKKGADT